VAEQFASVDDYLAAQPPDVQQILDEVRRRVAASVPDSVEAISYNIPAFKLNGRDLLYVAAWKRHISIYPIPDGDEALERDIERYRAGKGTLQFPLSEPFPFDLVDRLAAAAVAQRRKG
jgi:uncharacterized protein YdhG (YjbR/CyaY superfamily)